jgi:protein-L-isoaspartate O-methyltransferase
MQKYLEIFRNKILSIYYYSIVIIENIIYKYDIIKIKNYEKLFGNNTNNLSTPNLFYLSLNNDEIIYNSTILDVGCGSGICYKNNAIIDLIIKKELEINCIDINKTALDNFQKYINNNNLNYLIQILQKDLFNHTNKKYDYVIFSESAPVIPEHILYKMINHIKNNLLNESGKIIFINNIDDTPPFLIKFFKSKLKYFTTVDFGQTLNFDYFNEIKNIFFMDIEYKILASNTLGNVCLIHKLYFIYNLLKFFNLHNYLINQYEIILSNKSL